MDRHAAEQAIAHDLEVIDIALCFAKGAARRPLLAHKRHCMAQIKAWNREYQIDNMSIDELLAELAS